jgi:arylformamidase
LIARQDGVVKVTEPVFLHYDQAALDREYDNRKKVSDFAKHTERWPGLSAQARSELDARLDIAYGPSAAETLDVFLAAEANAPVQVFFHGGYWKALDKNDFSFVAYGLQPMGATTVVVNYGLMPNVDMAELIRQCRAALVWVWRNVAEFGGDPARIHISGHSAGGHITAMMLATDWPKIAADLPPDLIKTACGISGLYDLEPIQRCFLNDDLKMTLEQAQAHSPVRLSCQNIAPLLLPVGALEGPEYLRQSETLAGHWKQLTPPPQVWPMAQQDHFSIVTQLEHPDSDLSRALQRQMGLFDQ